ncbi:helix-turn-helix domain-containing protein [Tepidibacter hydrothermalis]|uniref:AraC family transcriptional regulator n=1 Tax=Tepidibacter hydrothermalis TaxID=3036126 RepID=A0ABY8EIV6_9FIRM|nr:AraC family transcriptional regulator [Tepidibacter hydrothermalis]WFD11849.1 AraC family transcriptional regulator [Tepidibacter hydrothermalis]
MLQKLYGETIKIVKSNKYKIVYEIQNESGNGEITVYNLFEGVQVIYNDLHFEYCEERNPILPKVIEINHCRVGRCECEFEKNRCEYMSEGDLAIHSLKNKKSTVSFFPLKHYHGITILLDFNKITEFELFDNFGVDAWKVYEKIINNNLCIIIRSNEVLEHIFYEFYYGDETLKFYYLRIKVMELLLYLTKEAYIFQEEKRMYLTKYQVEKTKQIKDFITTDITKHYTLEEISSEFKISQTMMKKWFKAVYGMGIYSYLKTYRLQQATIYLKESEKSIAEIANLIGYSNPAKLSTAFKQIYGCSPREYKKVSEWIDSVY